MRTRACVPVGRAHARQMHASRIVAGHAGQVLQASPVVGNGRRAAARAQVHPQPVDARAARVPVIVGTGSTPCAGRVGSGLASGASIVAVPDAALAHTAVAAARTATRPPCRRPCPFRGSVVTLVHRLFAVAPPDGEVPPDHAVPLDVVLPPVLEPPVVVLPPVVVPPPVLLPPTVALRPRSTFHRPSRRRRLLLPARGGGGKSGGLGLRTAIRTQGGKRTGQCHTQQA